MKKTKNKIAITFTLLLILIIGYYFIAPFFKTSTINLENEIAEKTINANNLVRAYSLNEEKSNKLYAGKIIEVVGFIKEITFINNRNTIILNSENETFGVICDINPLEKEKIKLLKKHQKVRIKGICKGFLKDVILLNCAIDLTPYE